jgi:hypothetical protein
MGMSVVNVHEKDQGAWRRRNVIENGRWEMGCNAIARQVARCRESEILYRNTPRLIINYCIVVQVLYSHIRYRYTVVLLLSIQ